MDKKTLIYGFIIGFSIAMVLETMPMGDAAIPPTRAIQSLNISLPWFADGDVLVTSESSTDIFFFVSDGSMSFNVTESPLP